jgi:hypothetical protein
MATADSPDDQPTAPGPIIERTDDAKLEEVASGIEGPFFQEVGKRKKQGRDAKILVTAKDGQTGVGKSNLCDFLGYVLDTSEEGFAPYKTSIDPQRFIRLYGALPPGSASVMEEGEQFDSRRSMQNENVDAAAKWQKARVREVVALVNLPSPSTIDTRFERLADYWINVKRRGKCIIYKKRIHPTRRKIYYETMQWLEWPNMDQSASFKHMDQLKSDHLDDDDADDNWLREDEVKERVEKAEKQVREDMREQWIKALKDRGWTGKEVASLPVVDVSSSRVNQIARGE